MTGAPSALPPGGPAPDPLFAARWARGVRDLDGPLTRLYAAAAPALLADIRRLCETASAARPQALRDLDLARDLDPDWFLSNEQVGYVCYTDRFAGRFDGIAARIPYLQRLGVTYLHLMPCLKPRPGESDGGYAVMDYRETDPRLGSMDDLEAAATALRDAGMTLCVDLVLNHTAAEHDWAEAARAGDPSARAMYRIFPDRQMPDAYERTLLEIFPDQAPGNFTHVAGTGWVWTTFNTWQWDLNWENPAVFAAFLDIILNLANRGVGAIRLDAVAFLWKRLGTQCQNLPEVHDILQALVQAARTAAPGLIFKAEAIVAPQELVPYLGTGRHEGKVSHLAYHNSLMVQAWSALAARDARLMTHVLRAHFPQSFRRAGFATYLRCHDDIGWAITPDDTAAVGGIDDRAHRAFLADFYAGRFPGSFARGADFQVNEATGDRRTNGTLASLAGLEAAATLAETDAAIDRILMLHAIVAAFGGLPLIYMGDEIGLLNDPDWARTESDGRWLHRPMMDWDRAARAESDPTSPEGRLLAGLRHILARRRAEPALAAWHPTEVLRPANPHLFMVRRDDGVRPLTLVANFSDDAQDGPEGRDRLGLWPATGDLPPWSCRWLG